MLQSVQCAAVFDFGSRDREFCIESFTDIFLRKARRDTKEIRWDRNGCVRYFILSFRSGVCDGLRIIIVDSHRPEILADSRLFDFNDLLHI